MSEYQYYEFRAVDLPPDNADQRALRAMSTRAQITATSFTNTYDWDDFKGDPTILMQRWFDLHLYVSNWGSRRLMIKLPGRLIDEAAVRAYAGKAECVQLTATREQIILDINGDEIESELFEDGSDRLDGLAPLRDAILAGDWRLFYLLWLMAVEEDGVEAEEPEPLAGIGSITPALGAVADFFQIDPDLVAAAAEKCPVPPADAVKPADCKACIAALPEPVKTGLLLRLLAGEPNLAAELRRLLRETAPPPRAVRVPELRTVHDLRTRAEAIAAARERDTAEQEALARKQQTEKDEHVSRTRQAALARRGNRAWQDVELEIERGTASGYDRAARLLADLHAIAAERRTSEDFVRRLQALRERHSGKKRFLERMADLA